MSPALLGWIMISGLIFVPTFIVALAMLRSARRALVLAATFSFGASLGFLACAELGRQFIEVHASDVRSTFEIILFATAGAAGVGVFVVFLLGKVTGHPPWRRL